MRWNSAYLVYVLGVILLAAAYYPLKDALPTWGFVLAALAYLVGLRVLADFMSARREADTEERN